MTCFRKGDIVRVQGTPVYASFDGRPQWFFYVFVFFGFAYRARAGRICLHLFRRHPDRYYD
jgi:hypothetical protein